MTNLILQIIIFLLTFLSTKYVVLPIVLQVLPAMYPTENPNFPTNLLIAFIFILNGVLAFLINLKHFVLLHYYILLLLKRELTFLHIVNPNKSLYTYLKLTEKLDLTSEFTLTRINQDIVMHTNDIQS